MVQRSVHAPYSVAFTVVALIVGYLPPILGGVRAADPPTATQIAASTSKPASSISENERLLHWRQTFFWAAILVLIFFFAVLAIIRFTLRYRAYLFRDKPPPTPSEDVWKMHRLPGEDSDALNEFDQ